VVSGCHRCHSIRDSYISEDQRVEGWPLDIRLK
jgi:hypothetical protein